jgi:hypothetical protein
MKLLSVPRICPGRHLSVSIVLNTMPSTTTISEAKDENEHEITPEIVHANNN